LIVQQTFKIGDRVRHKYSLVPGTVVSNLFTSPTLTGNYVNVEFDDEAPCISQSHVAYLTLIEERTYTQAELNKELDGAHKKGFDAGYLEGNRVSAKPDTTTKLLLNELYNELYHDRDRLERIVQDAVSVIEALQNFVEGGKPAGINGVPMNYCSWAGWLIGLGDQFIDSHGSKDGD
jgi:hypothetical protein